jgi:glutaconyl-CoA/methylmalonyl-CoA decarboxylase subunit gamma
VKEKKGGFAVKKYYVTVNGNRYEVEVEEVKGDFSPSIAAAPTVNVEPRPVVKPQPVQQAPQPVKEEVKEAPKPAATSGSASGEAIECPMPGTILKVNITEGNNVKQGDVLFVLEAMKMENEIMAPKDGKVVQINVAKGAVVNTGDTLAVLQ